MTDIIDLSNARAALLGKARRIRRKLRDPRTPPYTRRYAETRELPRIESAVQRIDEGTYGFCLDCGETIGTERLRAIPEVTVCIECRGPGE